MKSIIGIMQPYFFPYLGYFSLINYSDTFIFFDTTQYIWHGWVNRNRILKRDGTTTYIIVPIQKTKRETAIKEIEIANHINWKERIYGQLTVYKKRAPKYNDTIEVLHSILDKYPWRFLSLLNIEGTIEICRYIGIETKFDIFSQMDMYVGEGLMPDEWALNITKEIGGGIYVNPPGGQSFFRKNMYEEQGIELQFLQSNLPLYIQRIGHYEPGLSIIDIMMFCDKKEILDMLNDYRIIK